MQGQLNSNDKRYKANPVTMFPIIWQGQEQNKTDGSPVTIYPDTHQDQGMESQVQGMISRGKFLIIRGQGFSGEIWVWIKLGGIGDDETSTRVSDIK